MDAVLTWPATPVSTPQCHGIFIGEMRGNIHDILLAQYDKL